MANTIEEEDFRRLKVQILSSIKKLEEMIAEEAKKRKVITVVPSQAVGGVSSLYGDEHAMKSADGGLPVEPKEDALVPVAVKIEEGSKKRKCPKCGRVFYTDGYRMPKFSADTGVLPAIEKMNGHADCCDCGTEIEFWWRLERMEIHT
jgi:hypothetical protein